MYVSRFSFLVQVLESISITRRLPKREMRNEKRWSLQRAGDEGVSHASGDEPDTVGVGGAVLESNV